MRCAQMQRMLRWERYKGGGMYRLLRDNVYLAKEYILKNIRIYPKECIL